MTRLINDVSKFGPRRFWSALAMMIVGLLLTSSTLSALDSEPANPFQGTFLQLTREHQSWPPDRWQQLFLYLKELGVSRLIIQWTVFDDYIVFPYPKNPSGQTTPLEIIMSLAEANNVKVRLGLVYDPGFWGKINRPPDVVAVYLRHLRGQAEDTATQLAKLYGHSPAFQGWYLPEEIDDIHWQELAARDVLLDHLAKLRKFLRGLTPKADTAISGFVNGRLDPQSLSAFWLDLLTKSGIEVFLLQDGIGVNKLTIEELALYLQALTRAIKPPSCELRMIVETFQQTSGSPSQPQSFQAVPAPLPRLLRQLQLADRYAGQPIFVFGVPEYLTPMGGEAARRLYQDYLAALKKKNKGG